jgi:hypothetical protein
MAIKSGGKCNNATFSSISRTLWQVREAMTKAGVTAGHAEAV